jgi:hypothetical protein
MLDADDFANKNSVVATGVNLPGLAFNVRKRVADERLFTGAQHPINAQKPVIFLTGKPPAKLALVSRHNIHGKSGCVRKQR